MTPVGLEGALGHEESLLLNDGDSLGKQKV
jgi:hypothetical protein